MFALATLVLIAARLPQEAAPPVEFDLDRALAACRVEDVAADVRFLSDPALRGRATPSPELRAAALYLAARAQNLGLEPGRWTAGGSSWLQEYELIRRRFDPGASDLELATADGRRTLVFGRDYVIGRRQELRTLEAAGELLALGRGEAFEDPELDLSGRWGLLFDTGRSILGWTRKARDAGAAGLLVVRAADSRAGPFEERYAALTEELRTGWIESPVARRGRAGGMPVTTLTSAGAGALAELAGTVPLDAAGTLLPVRVHERRGAEEPVQGAVNVMAFWPGSDPDRAREVLVLCAHFDHVGAPGGVVHPGADDNASGGAALLAVGQALAAGGRLERSVLVLWLSGEERGFWGAAAWAAAPGLPPGYRPVAALNLDMVGRTAPDELYLTPTAEHPEFNGLAAACGAEAEAAGFAPLASQDEYWARSDHYRLHVDLGIPVAYLSSGDHGDYHLPSDTVDKLDCEKVARVAGLVVRVLAALEGQPLEAATDPAAVDATNGGER